MTLISPAEHVGALISECEGRSGVQQDQRYLGADRAVLRYTLPLAEIATDFHDRVKSISNGFASLDYEPVTLVRVRVRVRARVRVRVHQYRLRIARLRAGNPNPSPTSDPGPNPNPDLP